MRCRNCGAAFTESMRQCAQCGVPTGIDEDESAGISQRESGQSTSRSSIPVVPIALGALSVILVFILIAGSLWAFLLVRDRDQQIDERDEAIIARDQMIVELSDANKAFQDELTRVTGERDGIATELEDQTEQAETLQSEIDGLETERAELETTLTELEGEIEENERQLGQSRQEATDQQTRADDAESLSVFLVEIIIIDEEIQSEYATLLEHVLDSWDYYENGMTQAGDNSMLMALDAIARLDELFEERQLMVDGF